ncbi:protocadherin 15, partial [Plakobranchus ocellatus]
TVLLSAPAESDMSWSYQFPSDLSRLSEYLSFTRDSAQDVFILALTKPIDFELLHEQGINFQGVTSIKLFCEEPGRPNTESNVILEVNYVNEFTPEFNTSSIEVTVKENTAPNTQVLNLLEWASDEDYNPLTREISRFSLFSLGSDNQALELFRLSSPYDGTIEVRGSLDFDILTVNNRRLVLGVRVYDTQGLSSTANVTFIIEDEDDLPPAFFYDGCADPCNVVVYRAFINPNFTGDVDTIRPASIQARDGDTLGSAITYHLIQGPEDFENYFSLDSSTARLTVTKQLHSFSIDELVFIVEAREVSATGRSSRASLLISLGGVYGVASSRTSTDDPVLAAAIALGILFFIVVVCLSIGLVFFRKKYKNPVHPEGTRPITADEGAMAEDGPRSRSQHVTPVLTNQQQRKPEIKENGVIRTNSREKASLRADEEMITWMPIAAKNDIVDLSDEDTIKKKKKMALPPTDTKLHSRGSVLKAAENGNGSEDTIETSIKRENNQQEHYPETEYAELDTPPTTRKDLPVVMSNRMYGLHSATSAPDTPEKQGKKTQPTKQQQKQENRDVDDAEYATPRESEEAVSIGSDARPDSRIITLSKSNGKDTSVDNAKSDFAYTNKAFKKDEPQKKPPRRPGSKRPNKGGETASFYNGSIGSSVTTADQESKDTSESYNSSVSNDLESQSITGSGILYSTENESPRLPARRQWTSTPRKETKENRNNKEDEVTEYSVPPSNRSSYITRPLPLPNDVEEARLTSINLNQTQTSSPVGVVPLSRRQNRSSLPPRPIHDARNSSTVSALEKEDETEDPYATVDKLKKSLLSPTRESADQHDDADQSGEGEGSSANDSPTCKSANGSFSLQAPSRRKRPRKRNKQARAPEEDVYDGTKDYEDLEVDSGFYTDTSKTKIKRSSRLPVMKPDPNDTRYWITVTNEY